MNRKQRTILNLIKKKRTGRLVLFFLFCNPFLPSMFLITIIFTFYKKEEKEYVRKRKSTVGKRWYAFKILP